MVCLRAVLLCLLCAPPSSAEEPLPSNVGTASSTTVRTDAQAMEAAEDPAEQRRLRREARRARRRALRAQQGASAAEQEEEEDPEDAPVQSKGKGAMQKAQQMGDELKKSLGDGSAGDLGGSGSGGGDGPSGGGLNGGGAGAGPELKPAAPSMGGPIPLGGASGSSRGGDPTHPKTQADLVLAVTSGFAGSLTATGLKVGSGPGGGASFQRQDGSPATEGDLQSLREHIESEPAALMRRPDFFTAVSREHYQSLKQDYRGRPDLKGTAFKDVELTPKDRDFIWSVSCDKLSGNCNKQSSEASYKKKTEVPPEDLDSIWAEVNEGENSFLKAVMTGGGTAEPPQRKGIFSAGLDGLYDRLDALAGGVESFFGKPEGGGDGSAGESGGAAASADGAARHSGGGDASGGKPGTSSVGPKGRRLPSALKDLAASAGTRPLVAGLGGVAAVVGLFLMLRRRDDD